MDYLPIQATSVPCERVFSSAKETDTPKRNRMSPVLMEALQLFKFMLKKQRLDFIGGWATSEAAMAGEPASNDDVLDALVKDQGTVVMDDVLSSFYSYD
jgi:hypothetical protein